MADSRTIPPPDFDDDDPAGQAAWEIATAETLRARGDLADAASWYRRAANHLMEAGDDERAIEVAKLAAELVALESAVRPASERTASKAPPAVVASVSPNTASATPVAKPEPAKAKAPEPAPGSAAAKIFGPGGVTKPTGQIPAPGAAANASANNAATKSVFPTQSPAQPPPHKPTISSSPGQPTQSSLPKPTGAHPRPASVAPPPATRTTVQTPSLGTPSARPPVPGPAPRVPGPARSITPQPQPAVRPSAYAAPASPAARNVAIPPPAAAVEPQRAPPPDGGDTSVISLGAIASPIASLLDEAVANLEPVQDASSPAPVAKRPLSFLPQRAAESESIAARLSALPLFSDLPADSLRQLSRQLITESRSADENVCESGAPEGPLYVILSGSAWVGVAGRASPLAVLTAGDFVGEVAALYGGPRTATVVAREPMELVGVSPSVLRAMARDFPAFRESLIESVRERMTESLPHIATSLRRLTDEARKAIMAASEFVELAEGAEMMVEGEPAPALFIVAAGEAECFGGELGVSKAVRARVGEIVGASSVITGTPSGVSARAARTLLAAKISRDQVRELLKTIPSIADLLEDVAAPGRGVVC